MACDDFNSAASAVERIGGILPWSACRPENPAVLPDDLAAKNTRELNPLASPRVYERFYDGHAGSVSVTDPSTHVTSHYELYKNINDPESGFHAKVIVNPETGHAIMLLKGMDMPGRDEGAGSLGFTEDLGDRHQSVNGNLSDQVLVAEKAYLEMLSDPNLKSVEVAGYSIGSIPANYLAATYGAQVTNIANLGVPNANSFDNWGGYLNWDSKNDFPEMKGGFLENINKGAVNLVIAYDDFMGGNVFGDVGAELGNDIYLDSAWDLNVQGAAHVPAVYAEIAEKNPETPKVTMDTVFDGSVFRPHEQRSPDAAPAAQVLGR